MINCIIVTGSCGGLGKSIIDHFIDKSKIIIGIDKCSCESKSNNHIHITSDLSKHANILDVCSIIETKTSSIDLLLNIAGVFYDDKDALGNQEISDYMWQTNLVAPALLSDKLFYLLEKGINPSIINITSTDGIVCSAGQDCEVGVLHDMLYASTKGALTTLTKASAMKYAPKVRVNAIAPTIIRTPMAEELLTIDGKEKEICSYIPLNRICHTDDILIAIDALSALTFTTGHTLTVDGGYLCQ